MMRACWLLVAGVGLMIATACAPQNTAEPQTSAGAVFFPQPPAPPRLQFLTSFRDAAAFADPAKGTFAQWVVGQEKDTTSRTRLDSPYGVAAHDGRLYICDVGIDCVHVIDLITKEYSRLDEGAVRNPVNITIDADGTKYVCDTGAHRVLVFDAQDKYVTAFGDPTAWTPIDLAIAGDELMVADVTGGKIHVYSKTDHKFLRNIGKKGPGPDELTNPTNLDMGPDGKLYVTDTIQQMIKVYTPSGDFVGAIGGPGADIGHFARPKGIAIDPHGVIFVADSQWDVVQLFNPDGKLLMVFGEPGEKPYAMGLPAGLCIDATSLPQFRKYIAKSFDAEYLLLVVNQFGFNKIAVYAFGTDRTMPASAYEVDMAKVDEANKAMRAKETPTAPSP